MSGESRHRRCRSINIEDDDEEAMQQRHPQRRKESHSEWGVSLKGFSSGESTRTSAIEEWAAALLKDNGLLEYDKGNPISHCCQLKQPKQAEQSRTIYMEFRCAAEHRRFLRLQEESFFDGSIITIRNWQDDNRNVPVGITGNYNTAGSTAKTSTSIFGDTLSSSLKSSPYERKKSPRKHAVPKLLPEGTRFEKASSVHLLLPEVFISVGLAVEYLHKFTMKHKVANETAILGWQPAKTLKSSIPRTKVILLKTESPEAAAKICLCNGLLLEMRGGFTTSLVLRRPNRIMQLPIDWYSYYWARHKRAAPDCRSLARATIKNLGNEELPSFGSLLSVLNSTRKSKEFDGNFVKLIWQSSRTEYDFLIQASSPDAARALSTIHRCKHWHIVWSLCHEKPKETYARADSLKAIKALYASVPIRRKSMPPTIDAVPSLSTQLIVQAAPTKATQEDFAQKPRGVIKVDDTVPRSVYCDDLNLSMRKIPHAIPTTIDTAPPTHPRRPVSLEGTTPTATNPGRAPQKNPCCVRLQLAMARLVTENQKYQEQTSKLTQEANTAKSDSEFFQQQVQACASSMTAQEKRLSEKEAQLVEQEQMIQSLRSEMSEKDRQHRHVAESLSLLTTQQSKDREALQEMGEYVAAEKAEHRNTKKLLVELQEATAQTTTTEANHDTKSEDDVDC